MKDDDPMGTLLDFNTASPVQEKPDHSRNNRERIERIRLEANANALAILHHLLPGGRIVGSEFEAGNVTGSSGHSFKFSLRSDKFGVWSDFATEQTGGDIIDLWKTNRKCDFKTAIDQIEQYLHLIPLRNPDGHSRKHETRTDRAEKTRRDLGPPTNTWYYHDASGNIIAKVTRYDPEPGEKEFRPWDCRTNKCTHPSPRPLYNLPGILSESRIVLVEGEKCADALISLGIPATTAMGGSHAPPDKTDWTALQGKEVVIWRDNDNPGIKYAENACKAIEAVGGTVKILPIPEGKPAKWDVADAVLEGFDVKSFLDLSTPSGKTYRVSLSEWKPKKAYSGPAPEREWLVNYTFPMAAVSVIAATGGCGKSMLGLDLALKISCDFEPDLLNTHPEAFGNRVMQHGTVVYLSAEDDRNELLRRMEALDPLGKRFKHNRTIAVPLPDTGGPMPLIVGGKRGPEITGAYLELRKQLLEIEDLKLLVIDPLGSFVMADIIKDSVVASFTLGQFAALAKETGAAIIIMHHLSKLPIGEKGKITVDRVRSMIKGVTGIVDHARLAYALWSPSGEDARSLCRALNVPWERNKVIDGAVVKQNGPVDLEIKHFLRNEHGLLTPVNEMLQNLKIPKNELMDILVDVIGRAAAAGRPFTLTAKDSCFSDRKDELPFELKGIGRDRLVSMCGELMEKKRAKKCAVGNSKTAVYLDVPGGKFWNGQGSFEPGYVEI